MNIDVTLKDDELNITLIGRLDDGSAMALSERLLLLCRDRLRERIAIDLARCETVGSLGFGALVSFRLAAPIAPLNVRLCNVSPDIREGIRVLRLDKLFDIQETAQ